MSQVDDIQKLITIHHRRLQKLKERQAMEGVDTDPVVLIQIEDIETELAKLEEKLMIVTGTPREKPGESPSPGKAVPVPSFRQVKINNLEKCLADLIAEYEAANNQFNSTLGEVERLRLKRQIETLEKKIGEVEAELKGAVS